jgi:hypothetical protein
MSLPYLAAPFFFDIKKKSRKKHNNTKNILKRESVLLELFDIGIRGTKHSPALVYGLTPVGKNLVKRKLVNWFSFC